MNLGVVDDIAVLAETDIRGKEKIVQRKSVYAQQKQQLESQEEQLKDQAGTIETLQRQLVQAGIKNKVMQLSVEISKQPHNAKSSMEKEVLESKAHQRSLRESLNEGENQRVNAENMIEKETKRLENTKL